MKIALEINNRGVKLALYERRWRGWQRSQYAELPWRQDAEQAQLGEQLVSTLRPSLLLWGVKPETTVIVVPDMGVGGVLHGEMDSSKTEAETIEALIGRHLPFPMTELAVAYRKISNPLVTSCQLAWIPLGWLAELRDALERLGLRLDEVYPAAFLMAEVLPRPITARHLWVNQAGSLATAWSIRPDGWIDAFATVDLAQAGFERRLPLAMLAMTGGETWPAFVSTSAAEYDEPLSRSVEQQTDVIPVSAPSLVDTVFRCWLNGGEGWWQAPRPDWLVARTMPWLIGCAVIVLLAMAAITWQRQHLVETTNKLDDAAAKLRPAHRRLESRQRELFQLTGELLDVDGYDHAKPALDLLASVTDLLPDNSWVTRYQFDGRDFHLEGEGISNGDLTARLAKIGYIAQPAKATQAVQTAQTAQTAQPNAPKVDAKADVTAKPPITFALDIHERPSAKAKIGH